MTGGPVRGWRPIRSLHRDDNGFSLVEAVVSITILGLLVALAFSGRSLIDNRRLAGAARALGTDVRWVEQRARTERRCWQIVFHPSAEHYHIQYLAGGSWTAGGGCSGGAWTDYTPVAGQVLPARIDLAGTTFGSGISGSDTMTVSPFGSANAGAVTLSSPGGEQRGVTVNAAGRVTITR